MPFGVTPFNDPALPNRTFLFVEAYCVEPKCDCRTATAFEPPRPPFEDEGQPFLNPLNPQSPMSYAFLKMFEKMIVNDDAYSGVRGAIEVAVPMDA